MVVTVIKVPHVHLLMDSWSCMSIEPNRYKQTLSLCIFCFIFIPITGPELQNYSLSDLEHQRHVYVRRDVYVRSWKPPTS